MWCDYCKELKLTDKANIPQELKYLDRGHGEGLTFQKTSFLPFAQRGDLMYKECTKEENVLKFGKNIPEVKRFR